MAGISAWMASFRRWHKLNAKRIVIAEPWASPTGNNGGASACGVMDWGSGIKKALLPFREQGGKSDLRLLYPLPARPNNQVNQRTHRDLLQSEGNKSTSRRRRGAFRPYWAIQVHRTA